MNVRQVYDFLQKTYPKESRNLNPLAWPPHNPPCGIQFTEKGQNVYPLLIDPLGYLEAEPLVGPFYNLNVTGFAPVIPLTKMGKWKHFSLVVDISEELTKIPVIGSTTVISSQVRSAIVDIRIKTSELKGLASKLGMKWYHSNKEVPWNLTEFSTLDKCIQYERKDIQSRVQLHR